jgi:hypothetical protein
MASRSIIALAMIGLVGAISAAKTLAGQDGAAPRTEIAETYVSLEVRPIGWPTDAQSPVLGTEPSRVNHAEVTTSTQAQQTPTMAVSVASQKTNTPATAFARNPSNQAVETTLVTGSRIPQKAAPLARIMNTAFPLYVIDRQTIERSGASSVAQVLRTQGFAH